MKRLTKSHEDYLEAIYMLELSGQKIKSVRISEKLSVSRPAVNRAMNDLFQDGLILKSDYSELALTEKGRQAAAQIYKKHTLIKEFLIKLGVSDAAAETDCCKIEHAVSDETLCAIKNFLK